MTSGHVILLIVAIICWFIAAIGIVFPNRVPIAIGWLGMFFFGLSMLVK